MIAAMVASVLIIGPVCEPVTPEQSVTAGFVREIGDMVNIQLSVCRVPRGTYDLLVFSTSPTSDGRVLVVSQDIEDLLEAESIRAMVAHEFGHLLIEARHRDAEEPKTVQERLAREQLADTAAAAILGSSEALERALLEFDEIYERKAARAVAILHQTTAQRRHHLNPDARVESHQDSARPLEPGNTYGWMTPCTVVKADSSNRIERLATGYLWTIQKPYQVIRCVQPEGFPRPIMNSLIVAADQFMLIYSEEMDDPLFPELAIKGLVAHEVAHVSLNLDCSKFSPGGSEYTACESTADREAARIAGQDAVVAALTEFHRLDVRMTTESLARTRRNLIDERLKRLQQAPAAR